MRLTGSFHTIGHPRPVEVDSSSTVVSGVAFRRERSGHGCHLRTRPRRRPLTLRIMLTSGPAPPAPALLTDHYELTMVGAALRDGTADRALRLRGRSPAGCPHGRRYGVVAGTGRLLEALPHFRFGDDELDVAARARASPTTPAARLAGRLPLHRRHRRLRRGRAVLPRLAGAHRAAARSPRAWCWRRSSLSVLNHDSAIAVGRRPHGHRRRGPAVHRDGLPAHPRGGRGRRGPGRVPGRLRVHLQPRGRPALRRPDHRHRRARVHAAARRRARPRSRSQVATLGKGTTLLVDTYDIEPGHPDGDRGRRPGAAARSGIDSGDLPCWPHHARELLDSLGATETRIVVTGDLDEYAIAGAGRRAGRRATASGTVAGHRLGRARPPAWSTSWSRWTGGPVAKRSEDKATDRRPQDRPSAGTSRPAPRPRRSWSPHGVPGPATGDRPLQRAAGARRRAGVDLPDAGRVARAPARVPDLAAAGRA